jgi:site-specific recombinase XerD
VCYVDIDRLDVARSLIEILAMKSRKSRIVGYSSAADPLLAAYFAQWRAGVREAG